MYTLCSTKRENYTELVVININDTMLTHNIHVHVHQDIHTYSTCTRVVLVTFNILIIVRRISYTHKINNKNINKCNLKMKSIVH